MSTVTSQVEQELEHFQGTWWVVSRQMGEQKASEEEIQATAAHLIIDGDQLTLKVTNREDGLGTLRIDPTKTPKEIDISFHAGPHKGDTTSGIYEIDNGTLTVCWSMMGTAQGRPDRIATGPGMNTAVLVYQRRTSRPEWWRAPA